MLCHRGNKIYDMAGGNARLLMNRKKKNIFMALSLSAVLAIGIPCYAGTTQEQIDAVSGEKAYEYAGAYRGT